MLSVVMLNIFMVSVIILSVVVPLLIINLFNFYCYRKVVQGGILKVLLIGTNGTAHLCVIQ